MTKAKKENRKVESVEIEKVDNAYLLSWHYETYSDWVGRSMIWI